MRRRAMLKRAAAMARRALLFDKRQRALRRA